ncbi:sugar ABC transporter substrate-binding protein [Salinisphaera hydrothermalis]|uniref:sugar ABC transporter substrate-binding protein n=1 Tax=Salinisphaera hydrothermalis TaxID=563188 RepID=UPI00333EFB51
MKNTWKIISVAVALCATCSVASAADTPSWLKQPLKKPLSQVRIGITQNNAGVDAYETTYEQSFKDYAKKLGIQAIVLDPQGDPARQSNQIQDLTAQRVDVMIVWPTNAKALVPAVCRAKRAGIPVVITNSRIDKAGRRCTIAFSGPDTTKEGRVAGRMMVQALNGKGNVVMINGTPGYATAVNREEGFKEAVGKHKGIKILDAQPADWNRAKAQSVMESFITKYGEKIDGVFAADDNMGAGALNAIKSAGIPCGRIKITGATNFAVGYDAIKAGCYYGSVVQSPVEDARNALKMAVKVAEGQSVPKTSYIDTPSITKNNIDKHQRPVF